MATKLHISKSFSLPLELVTSTQAILARKRSGKSYTASVEAEELLAQKQQIAVIDPTSAWWGLRSSADGEGPGYSVVVFGGDHADAPLDHRAGRAMAQALVEHGFSAIFDIGNMHTEEQVQFVMEFCSEMLRINRQAIHIFMDEADTFAPQKPLGLLQNKCLGTVSRLVKQGGIKGLGFTMITQRPQSINKDVLSQVDILTVLRMSHPLDIKAATDWIKSEVTVDFAKQVEAALPSLPVGTGFFCSASLGFGERVAVRTRRTFNSGATPKPGERKVEPKVLAKVDIEKLGAQISESVKRAQEDSPEYLKKRIRELEIEVSKGGGTDMGLSEDIQRMEQELAELRPLRERVANAERLADEKKERYDAIVSAVRRILDDIYDTDGNVQPVPLPPRALKAPSEAVYSSLILAPPSPEAADAAKSGPARRILGALAQLRSIGVNTPPRIQVCVMSGYGNMASTGFAKAMSALNVAGLLQYGPEQTVSFTAAGLAEAPHVPVIRGNAELHAKIYETLGGPETKILRQLIAAHPSAVEREVLMAGAGYSNQASTGFAKALSRLSTLRYVNYPGKGLAVATEQCFIRR